MCMCKQLTPQVVWELLYSQVYMQGTNVAYGHTCVPGLTSWVVDLNHSDLLSVCFGHLILIIILEL